jgi:hypothetical protein
MTKLLGNLDLESIKIDFTKPVSDDSNAEARKTPVKFFLSPNDPQPIDPNGDAPTNYLFVAGSKASLVKNDGIFYQDSGGGILQVANGDGTQNTLMIVETLRGNPQAKPMTVQRQHVKLDKDALGKLTDDSGVQDFKDGKNIAGNRGSSWMNGDFLQTTFTGTRLPNDSRPDVDCGGLGGLSAIRAMGPMMVCYADCSVRMLNPNIDLKTMKAMCTINGGEAIGEK